MTTIKTIAIVAAIALAPLPATAHNGEIGRLLGGLFGAAAQALCRGQCPPPPVYYPPPSYYPGPYDQGPPPSSPSAPGPVASDPDITFVQHALNVLDNAGLAEDGVGGAATKTALLNHLRKELGGQS